MVTVPALTHFEHGGQSYRRGDQVTLAPIDAAALSRLGYVSLVVGEVVAPEPRRRRRQYQRRDMTASR
jgi:hypothetical protein